MLIYAGVGGRQRVLLHLMVWNTDPHMVETGSRIPHIRALDGLRGIAVAGVLLFHSERIRGGYLGVDLFFVLSGFLITSLLLAERSATEHTSLLGFWSRRARRLLPALGLVLVAVLIYSVTLAPADQLMRIRVDMFATIGYVANWRAIFRSISYFEILKSVPSPLDHMWSLAIEEQFYVIWPVVFLAIASVAKRAVAPAVLVVALLLGSLSTIRMAMLWNPGNVNRAYYGTDTRAFALFAGIALAAYVAFRGHPRNRVARAGIEVSAIFSVFFLAWMWLSVSGQSGRLYRGGFFVAGIAAALVIAAATNPDRGIVARVFSFGPLCWLGLISYGLYLWHWPINVLLTPDRTGLGGWNLFLVRTAVALLVALASYHFVEMPIRRGAGTARQWSIAIPSFVVIMVALISVATVGASAERSISNSKPGSSSGFTLDPRYSSMKGVDVLLLGDSMADSLAPGFKNSGVSLGVSAYLGCRLLPGTAIFFGKPMDKCPWKQYWPLAVRKYRPKNVVLLIGGFDSRAVKFPGSNQLVNPGDPIWNATFKSRLKFLIDAEAAEGAMVTVLTLPCFGSIPGAQVSPLYGRPTPPRYIKALNRVVRSAVAESGDRAQLADLFKFLCPNGKISWKMDGVVTRSDGVHLSEDGAELVVKWLLPKLELSNKPSK